MLRRAFTLLTLSLVLALGITVVSAQDEDDDTCAVDLATIQTLLDQIEADLANGDLSAAQVGLLKAESDLGAALAACDGQAVAPITQPQAGIPEAPDSDPLLLTETFTYRDDGRNLTADLRLPAGWSAQQNDVFLVFSNNPDALISLDVGLLGDTDVAGYLTVIQPIQLNRDGIDIQPLNPLLEDLAVAYATLDAGSISAPAPVPERDNAAYVTGTYSAGGRPMPGAAALIDAGDAYLMFFLASPQVDLVPLIEAITASTVLIPSSDL